jgi:hypothetical protein
MLGDASDRLKHLRAVLPASCGYLRNRTRSRPRLSKRWPRKSARRAPVRATRRTKDVLPSGFRVTPSTSREYKIHHTPAGAGRARCFPAG